MQKKIRRFAANVQKLALGVYNMTEDKKAEWDKVKKVLQDSEDYSDISDD